MSHMFRSKCSGVGFLLKFLCIGLDNTDCMYFEVIVIFLSLVVLPINDDNISSKCQKISNEYCIKTNKIIVGIKI